MTVSPATRTPVVAVGVYPWADVVIDLGAARRKTLLPDRLPQPRTQVDLPDSSDRIMLYRSQDTTWAPPGRAASWLITHIHRPAITPVADGAGRETDGRVLRVAILIDQSARTPGLSDIGSREVLPTHSPAYMFGPLGKHNATQQAAWVQTMAVLAEWVTSGEVAEQVAGWTVPQCRAWLRWFDAGVTSPMDRAVLEAAGARATTKARNKVEMFSVRRLMESGMGVDEAARWIPHLPTGEAHGAALAYQHGLSFADVAPYLGTRLDPLDTDRHQMPLSERLVEITRTLTDGWTSQGRLAVEAQAPEGCTSAAWADLWTQFMPAALASAYAAAGVPFTVAVRLHLTGQDPDPDALATMAALRD